MHNAWLQSHASSKEAFRLTWPAQRKKILEVHILVLNLLDGVGHMLHLISPPLTHILAIEVEHPLVKWTIMDKVSRKRGTKIAFLLWCVQTAHPPYAFPHWYRDTVENPKDYGKQFITFRCHTPYLNVPGERKRSVVVSRDNVMVWKVFVEYITNYY